MATQLPKLPDVERLSTRVIRILGGNPGKFTLQGTNTYLIGVGPKRILLDTGEGHASYISRLKSVLDSERCIIERVVLSHWHLDHIKGVPSVLELASSLSLTTAGPPPVHKHDPTYYGFGDAAWKPFDDGHRFHVGEGDDATTLRAIHSPGHTADHMAFLLEEESALFTADAVLGHGTAVFDDLPAYMSTLSLFSSLADFTGRAYPGHGAVIDDGKTKVREYIAHRAQREKQVLDVLGSDAGREWSSMDIVKVVYKNVPEALHVPAEGGVMQVLLKLEGDGRVGESSGRWRVRESKI